MRRRFLLPSLLTQVFAKPIFDTDADFHINLQFSNPAMIRSLITRIKHESGRNHGEILDFVQHNICLPVWWALVLWMVCWGMIDDKCLVWKLHKSGEGEREVKGCKWLLRPRQRHWSAPALGDTELWRKKELNTFLRGDTSFIFHSVWMDMTLLV